MSKAEVKPLVSAHLKEFMSALVLPDRHMSSSKEDNNLPFVRGSAQVLGLLVFRHGVPDLLSVTVDHDIEDLCTDEEADVVCNDAQKGFVAGIVIRLVARAIDLDSSASKFAGSAGA